MPGQNLPPAATPAGLLRLAVALAAAALTPLALGAADRPQWGQADTRNMVSAEKHLPATFEPGELTDAGGVDPATTRGVKWTARLGSFAYGSPVIADGRVYVGTNNARPRDPKHQGDRGVLMCFDENSGRFLWQLVVPKLYRIRNADWHYVGISSPPTVVEGRAYLVSNRGEVLCLDPAGLADGNAGPFRLEGGHRKPDGAAEPRKAGKTDADIVWLYDMVAQLGVSPHNASNCSVLAHGDLLYVCTSNGVEHTHSRPANPKAPSLIVLDRKTGKLVARDNANIGPMVFHGQWCSPGYADVAGRGLVFFGGGDGVCYAFAAVRPTSAARKTGLLETVWSFRADLVGKPVEGWASSWPPSPVGPSTVIASPVFHKNRIYLPVGGDPWHGKKLGGLYCIDATKTGDVTRSARVWEYKDLGQCVATVAVADGLVYAAAFDGRLHCLDADTGKVQWVHRLGGQINGSPLLADGKLYVGTGRGELWCLAPGRTLKILGRVQLHSPVAATPVAANGVLYVAANHHLYAIASPEE